MPQLENINHFLKQFKSVLYNKKQVQGPFSSVCGHYCTYFLTQRIRGIAMKHILDLFSSDYDSNDEMITKWINNKFDFDTVTYDIDFIVKQVCHALKHM